MLGCQNLGPYLFSCGWISYPLTTTKTLMQEASRIVLDGFALGSDVKEVRYPDRYMDKRGVVMWNKVMHLLGQPTLA